MPNLSYKTRFPTHRFSSWLKQTRGRLSIVEPIDKRKNKESEKIKNSVTELSFESNVRYRPKAEVVKPGDTENNF